MVGSKGWHVFWMLWSLIFGLLCFTWGVEAYREHHMFSEVIQFGGAAFQFTFMVSHLRDLLDKCFG